MNEAASSEERGWAMAAHLCGLLWVLGSGGSIAAIRVSDGTPYRYPFSWRLVK
jgi:uncharacterized Tic20 family protein